MDRGVTWEKVDQIDEQTFIYDTAIGPDDRIYVTADNYGLIRSIDDGETWEIIGNGIEDVDVRDVAIGNNGEIYLTTNYEYLYRSIDGGLSWAKITNDIPSAITSIVVDDENKIVIGSRNGVFISTDQGSNWSSLVHGIEGRYIYALTKDASGHLYAGTLSNGVFKTIESIE